jgi:hypothetical protein
VVKDSEVQVSIPGYCKDFILTVTLQNMFNNPEIGGSDLLLIVVPVLLAIWIEIKLLKEP